ncbi:MAG TPA: OmpA family protein [Terriglobales bacterium]|nr:OmpA family protein [Terriglobales bacterium]
MSGRLSKLLLALLFASCAVLFINSSARAQDESTPKYDIFLGYQWVHPGITVDAPNYTPTNPLTQRLPDMPKGGGGSITYNFTRHLGLEGDVGVSSGSSNSLTTISAGPRLMFRMEDAALFLHGLVGLNRLNVNGLPASDRGGAILGGGFDLNLFRSVSWRVFEADWMPTWHHYVQSGNIPSQTPFLNAVRLRTGVVFNFGGGEAQPVGATATVQPSEAMVGEPLTATATANNFNPKHTLTYDWTSTCGKITGNGTTASIDTHDTPGGNCTATVKVTDPKAKKNNVATASSNFTVKEPPKNPPTISCTTSPTSVQAGASVTVSCTCSSPDNVPVTVSNYSATSGSITGSGNTATLNTTGANPGKITVNASCSDQRGLNTPATTEVAIENPPPPPPPQVSPEVKALEARLALHSVYFPTAQPTKANPSGGLVKSQQATLTALAADFKKYLESKPDAKLTLEGHADVRGAADYNQALSERRVDRTKSFLIEQGVPAGNIETKAFGAQQQLTADQVKASVDQSPELTPGEKARILKNERTIILASNRRVDVTLSTTGQESVRQFPFNAADSLTLIGGREKPAVGKKAPAKKRAPMKKKP